MLSCFCYPVFHFKHRTVHFSSLEVVPDQSWEKLDIDLGSHMIAKQKFKQEFTKK